MKQNKLVYNWLVQASIIETTYPITFRKDESEALGQHLRNRHNVVMIGMKRVGISNFLRFFLYHDQIKRTYIKDDKRHLFIPVDLHDLVERELFPFWILTFKRIVDASSKISDSKLQHKIENLFLNSIQSNNLFLTIDNIRQSLIALCDQDILPTLFFIRFDRVMNAANSEFFANLLGLETATQHRLSYVFTSFRNLQTLSPRIFLPASVSSFAYDLYLKPAKKEDVEIIFQTYKKKYDLSLDKKVEEELFRLTDGYVQYMQLAQIILHEKNKKTYKKEELFALLLGDERVVLQAEELWESLSPIENKTLLALATKQKILTLERKAASYLWDTGMVLPDDTLFSPLYQDYVLSKKEQSEESSNDFSKKEHDLFLYLKENINEICERETIIEKVWPETQSFGVSDWAIDRLVARVRVKLKLQKSEFEIQTIKTRGYKLTRV